MARYKIYNGPIPTTAALASVTTGTAIKTMLQVKPSATLGLHVVEWGCSFDGSAAATPGKVELIETGTVAATVTASVANDINKYDAAALMGGDPTTNLIQVSTTATGYTATAEGTITASRLLMADMVAPTNQFVYQFPLGERPFVQANNILRVRVHFAAAINMICWVVVEV
jgi:hypothetical protein